MKSLLDSLEKLLDTGGIKKDLVFLIVSGLFLLAEIFNINPLPFNAAFITIALCGIPIILNALIGLLGKFDIKADVLVAIAIIAAVFLGEYIVAGEVSLIMQLGSLLEELTVNKARSGIEKLVKLTPKIARRIVNGKEEIVDMDMVKEGDVLRVLPGDTICVDGEIISGQTSIDQSVMTGESVPVDKEVGDMVYSGTINQYGAFEMKATKVGNESSIQKMIELVKSSDANKADVVRLADKWATGIVLSALTVAIITYFLTKDVNRTLTILIVFCPCSLVLATPTAIMAAVSNATKHGFLVREGNALERLSVVSKAVFDKTGTLTYGQPEVEHIESLDDNYSEDDIFTLAAIAENNSEHPLGKAVVKAYIEKKNIDIKKADRFQMIPGRGIVADFEDKKILAGNLKMLEENNIDTTLISKKAQKYLDNSATIIYLCVNGKAVGIISLMDTIKENIESTMAEIEESNVFPVLLTGDNAKAARFIAKKLNIKKFMSDCLPKDKLRYIEESQALGHKVCMVGDGINDAPSLKKAHVGIAMGAMGSDIAVDAADIVLVHDDIRELPHLLALSRKMMRTIKSNITFSMILNFIAILLAVTNVINPVTGALVHNLGSLFVIINAIFLLNWTKEIDFRYLKENEDKIYDDISNMAKEKMLTSAVSEVNLRGLPTKSRILFEAGSQSHAVNKRLY
ncbi:copper-(or silver)-translocating P-type ATPase [Acetitomaculum ruminis DSM 5522]|uniref:Cd(2+)-exporting ATPase n=1 Tax=Acetitomaculum ruminis DSM 5522 TaxID=1120918 RepID=A0A1I0YN40_9FIRM|nr:cation-translocating P-type ATPase [Acetitomaculum ruminis]SFB14196.1 copper-(or silver)-translocating P-type ATPase [Acetitomaculum ruminis DSM 5522]